MHKGMILITEAQDKNEAESKVENFLEEYKHQVWDWYVVGGRWSGVITSPIFNLNKKKKEEFEKMLYDGKSWINGGKNEIGKDQKNKRTEMMFRKHFPDFKGRNPYIDKSDGDDIVPLPKAMNAIKDWAYNLFEQAEKEYWPLVLEEKRKLKAQLKKGEEVKHSMVGFYAKEYGNMMGGYFNFDTNVYNIDEYEHIEPHHIKELKKKKEGYFAVMVDLHN